MSPLFDFHELNALGIGQAKQIAQVFDETRLFLLDRCGGSPREWAIVQTKLEEACFFAKKAMAVQPTNQKAP